MASRTTSIRRASTLALTLVGGCMPYSPLPPGAPDPCTVEGACQLLTTRLASSTRERLARAFAAQRSRGRVLVVHYDGERLYLLPGCRLRGHYTWEGLPADAPSETWDSQRARSLTHERGQEAFMLDSASTEVEFQPTKRAQTRGTEYGDRRGDCALATHFVSEFVVGVEDGAVEPLPVSLRLQPYPSPPPELPEPEQEHDPRAAAATAIMGALLEGLFTLVGRGTK